MILENLSETGKHKQCAVILHHDHLFAPGCQVAGQEVVPVCPISPMKGQFIFCKLVIVCSENKNWKFLVLLSVSS